jgi:tetratricopeptide (TPR) repeat protein
MSNNLVTNHNKYKILIYIVLALLTFAVYWQVNQFDFTTLDDDIYVTENGHVQSGISWDGVRWAFSTTYAEFWHPLTWISLMLDYQLYGLNPSGYHVTNLIFHILSTFLLFWLFSRMTERIWQSAIIAALFTLHPLHVESVVWVAERKDVLSSFFWMLTLCLYVYYTENPLIKRYWLVLFSFVMALMSKPMVVTLPVVMILLDYWPLRRFELKKANVILWQFKEKWLLFTLSAIFSIMTIYVQNKSDITDVQYPLSSRIINAIISFVTYLRKTFWPNDLIVCYDFFDQLFSWQVMMAFLLIVLISAIVIIKRKQMPSVLVGWFWYSVTILPVIGIITRGFNTMADLYTYLPLTGIFIILVWGIPDLIKNRKVINFCLLPASLGVLSILAFLSWHQCRYWENSMELYRHALNVASENYRANHGFGLALLKEGKIEEAIEYFNKTIRKTPSFAYAYNNLGTAYAKINLYQKALDDFNQAIKLKPRYQNAYNNRGIVYYHTGQYQKAVEDLSKAIYLKPDYVEAYLNRAKIYFKLGQNEQAAQDYNEAMRLNNNRLPRE